MEKKPQPSYVEFRNRQIIKQIQNLKKQEKEFLKEEENVQKKKHEKYREYTMKNNNNINELRKEIYGEEMANTKTMGMYSRGGNNIIGNKNNNINEREENYDYNNYIKNYNEEVKSVSNKDAKPISVKDGIKHFFIFILMIRIKDKFCFNYILCN